MALPSDSRPVTVSGPSSVWVSYSGFSLSVRRPARRVLGSPTDPSDSAGLTLTSLYSLPLTEPRPVPMSVKGIIAVTPALLSALATGLRPPRGSPDLPLLSLRVEFLRTHPLLTLRKKKEQKTKQTKLGERPCSQFLSSHPPSKERPCASQIAPTPPLPPRSLWTVIRPRRSHCQQGSSLERPLS